MTRSSRTSRFLNRSGWWLGLFLFAGLAFACEGSVGPAGPAGAAGAAGATGADGTDVDPATLQEIQDKLDELSKVEPESCATCHKDAPAQMHQDIYNQYTDTSALALTIIGVTSVDDGTGNGTFNSTMTFSITKGGLPYVDVDGLPTLDQKTFYTVRYEAGEFVDSSGVLADLDDTITNFGSIAATGTPGEYTAVATGLPYAPEAGNGVAYGYIADDRLDTASGGRVRMYNDVSNAGLIYGTVDYASPANVAGCVKCHGSPYMKHGYRAAEATNLPDFVACKACHADDREGSHIDWQILADDPARYAEIAAGSPKAGDEEIKYAYTANIMNDVHMTHAMEFPYPQSMSTCATCHEGKLDTLLVDANFTRETCRSCHALQGSATYGTSEHSLEQIWADRGILTDAGTHSIANLLNSAGIACNTCHKDPGAGQPHTVPTLSDLHNGGYDPVIYTDAADGTRYSDLFTATVDSATFNSTANTLTVELSASEDASSTLAFDPEDIVPTVMIGLYGWDTKDFLVSPHSSDANRVRLLEFAIDGVTTNPRFTVNAAPSGPGSWSVTADLSMWATELGDGTIKRAEIGVMPALIQVVGEEDVNVGTCSPSCSRGEYCNSSNTCVAEDDIALALNAPSRTFAFAANAFDDAYYADITDVAKCNACHDALGTTFHSGDRGGNIKVCRLCHVTTNGGSHLEMQSRSIDSYVHAIHSFQAFDSGDIDFSDPVEKLRYELHIEHVFPNFTAKNCEGCHNAGMYGVPDQSKSMPGKLSASDNWSGCATASDCERNIPTVPSLITGPATRACGGCHRAHVINEDDANRLIAFNQHTNANGYMVEDETLADGTEVFDVILETIMSIFD